MRFMTHAIAALAAVALCGGAMALAANKPHHAAGTAGQGWDHFAATFDTDKDGKVSKEELLSKAPGFDHLDTNKDGFVTKEEINALPASQNHPGMAGFVDRFDADKDGKVSKDEWNDKRSQGFDAADKNHDGFIEKDEFVGGAKELTGAV